MKIRAVFIALVASTGIALAATQTHTISQQKD